MRAPRTRVALAAALVGLLCLASCARTVTVVVEPGLEARWDALAAAHPLPRGYRWAAEPSSPDGGPLLLRVGMAGWRGGPTPAGATVLAATVLAATVPLLSPLDDVALDALRVPGTAEVVPLEEVALPRRLLSVAGSYPGDPGYPLQEELYAILSSRDSRLEGWLAATSVPPSAATPLHWIAAVGDTMLDRGVDALLVSGEAGAQQVFGDTLPVLRGADVLIGNLESAVTGRTRPATKAYTFRAAPEALRVLAESGFTYLTLTNNHSFDYGLEGFTDTLDHLRAAGLSTSGAGRSLREAMEPYRAELGGLRLRVWSLAAYPVERTGFDGRSTRATVDRPGVLWADDETVAEVARLLAAEAAEAPENSLDVLAIHGGEEWQSTPGAGQRRLYRALAAAGADLVLGSHPHVLQGMEVHHGSLIFYSLGNFVFPGMEGMAGATESVIALVGLSAGRIVAVRLVPVVLAGRTVRRASGTAARDHLLALSRALSGTGP